MACLLFASIASNRTRAVLADFFLIQILISWKSELETRLDTCIRYFSCVLKGEIVKIWNKIPVRARFKGLFAN